MKVFEVYEGKWLIPTNECKTLIREYTRDFETRKNLEQILFSLNENNEVDEKEVRTAFDEFLRGDWNEEYF